MKMDFKKLGITLIAICPVAIFAQDDAASPAAEYETLLRDIRGLEAYNALRQRQIRAQEDDLDDVSNSIVRVPGLERQLPPLLIEMTNGLREFVELDLPFLEEERSNRIANLYLIIENPDVPDSQKLRRVLEAWAIEVEYGNAFHTESGEEIIDGMPRAVDYVILGRVGLLYQTPDDDAITAAWDHGSGSWITLDAAHRNPVRQAIRMARSQIAPDLLLLPTLPPQP